MVFVCIFLACYIGAFAMARIIIGGKVQRTADHLKSTMPSANLDFYYDQMRGTILRGTIQMTLVTGTALGVLASVAFWAFL